MIDVFEIYIFLLLLIYCYFRQAEELNSYCNKNIKQPKLPTNKTIICHFALVPFSA